jgi:hypothetical protein
MSHFGYILEASCNNGQIVHTQIEAKTKAWVERKRRAFLNNMKAAELGHVFYHMVNEDRPYAPESYKVISRFNCPAFFDYWK